MMSPPALSIIMSHTAVPSMGLKRVGVRFTWVPRKLRVSLPAFSSSSMEITMSPQLHDKHNSESHIISIVNFLASWEVPDRSKDFIFSRTGLGRQFFFQGPDSKYSRVCAHLATIITTQLCHYHAKIAFHKMQTHEHGYVPMKHYL